MKLCVLTPSYDQSNSPFKADDIAADMRAPLEGHDFIVVDIHKATAARQVRELAGQGFDAFVNLCDGAWDDDCAGIEVVQALERLNLPFTGANASFYDPSRESMKRVCHYYGLPTPAHRFARNLEEVKDAGREMGFPLIVKHPCSYSSIGLTPDSRVENAEDLAREGARQLAMFGEVLIERFIIGREFTVLVAEDCDHPDQPVVFEPIEIGFPPGESFKHYDLKWVTHGTTVCLPCNDPALAERLKKVSAEFFLGLGGVGYGRCDIRVDAEGTPYLLEINPNCGLFYPPEDPGSADLILSQKPGDLKRFVDLILRAAQARVRRPSWKLHLTADNAYGLVATRDLAAGELIEAFEERPHVLVSRDHVERNWGERNRDWFGRYAYPISEDVWVMWSDRPEDWKPINHSCDPNAWLEGLNVVARKSIANGEAITLDYATFCHPTVTPFDCTCGSTECRGTISGKDVLAPFLDRYGDHISDYVRTLRAKQRTNARS